jgi:PAS domain S-box-containing protein
MEFPPTYITTIENLKEVIIGQWINNDDVIKVFTRHGIEKEGFRDNFATYIFDYYLNVMKEKAKLGQCPVMEKYLTVLHDKEVMPHELFIICTQFRRTLVHICYDQTGATQQIIEHIEFIADRNLEGVLKRYETIFSLQFQKITDLSTISDQYQTIVDKSSIVSKTDTRGIITYVNQTFCEISGYEESELIGKPHNIVRHIDMTKEAFKEMWETIQAKQIWQGEVKNRKKDGGYYVVLSTVMPIVDSKGNIVEFMSVRHDITDIYNLREEIEQTQQEVIFTMGSIGETRSKETGNHVKRVAEYSRILAQGVGLDEVEVEMIVQASPMHDIGKVAIADSILHKPDRLTSEEFTIMSQHAQLGYEMLKSSQRPLMKLAATIALEHHEWWDGSGGYPQNCKGEEISIAARITAVADVFDALGSDRSYKKAWDDEAIFELLRKERGRQFDPTLIDLFFTHLDDIKAIRDRFKDV